MSRQRRPTRTPTDTPWTPGVLVVLGLTTICAVWIVGSGLLHTITGQSAGDTAATPTATPHWVTIWSHTSHGDDETGTFSVPSHWRFVWSCDLASDHGEPYQVWVELKWHAPGDPNLDGLPYSYNEVQTTCQPGTTGGSDVIDGDPATIYADVTTWTDSAVVTLTAQVAQ